jgi:thioredoxin 1
MTQVTDETFAKEVLESSVPVLVDFYAAWCPPCRAAAPTIEALAKEYEGRVKVVKLDVDTGSENAVKQGVKGIPNFTIFKGGKQVTQFVGWADSVEKSLREALDAVSASE